MEAVEGRWPRLVVEDWKDTRDTLHRWTQLVGKVRMAHTPPLNHWWHTTLYLTPEGLTTSLIPHPSGGFELSFDFRRHQLWLRHVDGRVGQVGLHPRSVADFYTETMGRLGDLGVETPIFPRPVEVEDATPFPEDHHHAAYDAAAVETFWASLVDAHRVMTRFRSRFSGKASPVHFFWGAFDLAATRFSGRPAPRHPGGVPNCPDWVMYEAYSEEVSSAGYWPGGSTEGSFYSYAYPEPAGFPESPVEPVGAFYDTDLGEFVLPYEEVRSAPDPDATLMRFLQTTYAAAAELADWPRHRLEMAPDRRPPWTRPVEG